MIVFKRIGAVEKVLVKGFKFLSLGIYLTYLTYNVLSLSFLNTFSTGRIDFVASSTCCQIALRFKCNLKRRKASLFL
jgi:hypothetical protein